MFKEYDISFYGKRYKEKPTGKEIGEISRKLTANRLSYDFIAKRVGENGCVFILRFIPVQEKVIMHVYINGYLVSPQ